MGSKGKMSLSTNIERSQRMLARARRSLYRFPVNDMSLVQVFLFAGWLQLEEKAAAQLSRYERRSRRRPGRQRSVESESGL